MQSALPATQAQRFDAVSQRFDSPDRLAPGCSVPPVSVQSEEVRRTEAGTGQARPGQVQTQEERNNMTTKMNAIVQDEYGTSEVLHLAEIERPEIGPD